MDFLSDLFATLIGAKCFVCKKEHLSICSDCLNNLTKIDFPFCIGCDLLCIDGKTHLYCQQSCHIQSHTSTYVYKSDIKKLILLYKRSKAHENVIKRLVNQGLKDLESCIMGIDYVVPFPDTPKIIENNQQSLPELIATVVNKTYKIKVLEVLVKNSTIKQKERNAVNRFEIANDITIKPKYLHNIENKTILIIDDITTTGASIRAAAKILHSAGVRFVNSYTLAKDLRYN